MIFLFYCHCFKLQSLTHLFLSTGQQHLKCGTSSILHLAVCLYALSSCQLFYSFSYLGHITSQKICVLVGSDKSRSYVSLMTADPIICLQISHITAQLISKNILKTFLSRRNTELHHRLSASVKSLLHS